MGQKYVEIRDPLCIQLFVYTFCMNFVYKLYTCLYTKCIPYFNKFLYTFCIQNIYKIFVYKMYPIFRQTFVYILYTKFSWHSSFDFVYKYMEKLVEMWYTLCIYFVYILYTLVVCIFYNFCIQNVYTVSVWVEK